MSERSQRLEELFAAAAELPGENRALYLDQACADDPELRAQVERLLRSIDNAGSFLTKTEESGHSDIAEQPGDTIGRYKLLEKLGEGGFGAVYMAEQREPVKRRVALKIIKAGMDTKEVVARFEAERQALALMDHPNIAKVFDAGATENGRPYFVLELVRGIKITEYCEQNHLDLNARLKLFMQVCQAVQHAHQKGIIHRDLKPSNILVTLHDGVPVPKVIDFGIAKATQQELTEKTVFTRFHQFIGTPAYMSPEQAELSGLDIDTRSDIYSLGVLLYELLTGATPFDGQELLKAGLDEMRRTIREVEPIRPSTRLSSLNSTRPKSANRTAHSAIASDLDWIVMKCLEKDRSRRYETANGLSVDIQRHLTNEPVLARPPSLGYRFAKAIRRNKTAFATATAIIVALCLGLGLATWQYLEKNRAFHQAQTETRKAQQEATKSAQIVRFLSETLAGAGPFAAQGRDTTLLREILNQTMERLGTELKAQPDVESFLLAILGNIYNQIGDLQKAEAAFRRLLDLQRTQNSGNDLGVAGALNDLGGILRWQGRFQEAERVTREAIALHKKAVGETNQEYAGLLSNLSMILEPQGKLEEAEQLAHRAIILKRQLGGPASVDAAMSLVNLGNVRLHQGKLPEAESAYREALIIHAGLPTNEVNPSTLTLKTAALDNLGRVLERQRRMPEAEQMFREAVTTASAAWGEDNPQFAPILDSFVWVLTRQGKTNQAEQVMIDAIQRVPSNPTLWAIRSIWHARRGGWIPAVEFATRALELSPADHLRYHKLAPLLAQTGDLDAYRKLCDRTVNQFRDTQDPNIAERMAKDCLILPDSGADLKAVTAWVDLAMKKGEETGDLPWFQFAKALAEYRSGQFAQAAEWVQKTLNQPRANRERDLLATTLLSMTQFQLGKIDRAQEHLAKAQTLATTLRKLESGDLGNGWIDWIIAHLLLREAAELIDQSSFTKPSTKARP